MDYSVIRTETKIEALKSLEKLDKTLDEVKDDSYQWKWGIIIIHNCIQAFMVLALQGTAAVDVLLDNSKEGKVKKKFLRGELRLNQMKLDRFLNLYEKIKASDNTTLFCNGKKFNESIKHNKAMIEINEFRNDFIHFFPCTWSFIPDGLPEVFLSVMEIIEFLVKECGNFLYKFADEEKKLLIAYIKSIKCKLLHFDYPLYKKLHQSSD